MTIPSPNLDDRTFESLREQAEAVIRKRCPEWTDLSAHDPGMVLIEAFAYMTEALGFRMNRLPRKAYIEFLKLIGLKMQPPTAASVELRFFCAEPASRRIVIPLGTKITASRSSGGEPVIFMTDQDTVIEPDEKQALVVARHCESVEAEEAGKGTGLPGQWVRVRRPPIIAGTGSDDDRTLQVTVEPLPGEPLEERDRIGLGDKVFRRWREVESFSLPVEDPYVFVADRVNGLITFGPALQTDAPDASLGAAPGLGREIRVSYRRGGGASGNVVAGTLDRFKEPANIAGIAGVAQDHDATGGRAAETLEGALVRGPAVLHSLKRAVTARDFEALVRFTPGGVALVKAFTQRELWEHANPGTVDIVLVPDVPEAERGPSHEHIDEAELVRKQSDPERARVQGLLDRRRPLGTSCLVRWARYKSVSVRAEVALATAESADVVKARLAGAIYRALSPLDGGTGRQRGFGWPVRRADIYSVLSRDPGVQYVRGVTLSLDVVPGAVRALAADLFQPDTWYAACENGLFRSTNRAQSWERVFFVEGTRVERVVPHFGRPGLLAIVTQALGNPKDACIYLSRDCGETWSEDRRPQENLTDIAWTMRSNRPVLLSTTDKGLYEIAITFAEAPVPSARFASNPVPVTVDPRRPTVGFRAVTATVDARGTPLVAVAAMEPPWGIFLSVDAGASGSFRDTTLNEDIRVLEFQQADSTTTYLWAGVTVAGEDKGKGCFRREMDGKAIPTPAWQEARQGWEGGLVSALAFRGTQVVAASYTRGVMTWDERAQQWRPSELGCGLPENNENRLFQPVLALATEPGTPPRGELPLLLVGGDRGLFRRTRERDRAGSIERDRYVPGAPRDIEEVAPPPDWLICSGTHTVVEPGE
jgi:hypothetical protein